MIHTGNDFPKLMEERLKSWDATLIVEREADKPSTRGLLEYEDTTFGRANPSLQPDPAPCLLSAFD